MPIVDVEADGLSGLVTEALKIAAENTSDRFLWYRGHSKLSYTLLPGLLRHGKTSQDVFEREQRLLLRFKQRSLPFWPAGYPQNDWEHLFAMQHYGMPTRLLDWTENLFIAAHFALATAANSERDNGDDPPIIWCIDPIQWNRSTPVLKEYGDTIHVLTITDDEANRWQPASTQKRAKSPVAVFGTHNTNRIVAQRGTFIIWGEDVRSLESFSDESEGNLWRIKLTGDIERLKWEMNALGFVETIVFPELTSLGTELTRVEGWRSAQ